MHEENSKTDQEGLTRTQASLVIALQRWCETLTFKKLAKHVECSEEQVRQDLRDLGLEDIASSEREAERRKVRKLLEYAWEKDPLPKPFVSLD